jgi:putative selenate reductase FAD-binding subunit
MITAFLRPDTVKEAVRLKSTPGAAYLGGGTWLNSGRADGVTVLISLERLGLGGIETSGSACTIGAGVTFQQLVDSAAIPAAVPAAVRAAAALTASRTLRTMATVGGELGLCPDDSALIPALMVADAAVNLASSRKPLPIRRFIQERPSGLILSVAIPDRMLPCMVRAISRTSHSARSLVVAASMQNGQPSIVVSDCRGQRLAASDAAGCAALALEEDLHASAAYKRYMAGVLAADALAELSCGRGAQ